MPPVVKDLFTLRIWAPRLISGIVLSISFIFGLYVQQIQINNQLIQFKSELTEYKKELEVHRLKIMEFDLVGTHMSRQLREEVNNAKLDILALNTKLNDINITLIRLVDRIDNIIRIRQTPVTSFHYELSN